MEYFHWENEDIRFVSAHQYYNFQNLFEGNKIKGDFKIKLNRKSFLFAMICIN